jgi:hypothetical protein
MQLLNELEAGGRMDSKWGLPLAKDGGRDNFPVTTATFCALATDGELAVMRPRFEYYLQQAQVYDPDGNRWMGLFHREAGNPDFNSVDNYIGIVRTCQLLELQVYIEEIYLRGSNHAWVFDNTDPAATFLTEMATHGGREWFGRFLGFPGFATVAAGNRLGIWEKIKFTSAIQTDIPAQNSLLGALQHKPDVGNHILQWHENQGMQGQGFYLSSWQKKWARQMSELYPGGLSELLGYYFTQDSLGPNPIPLAAKGRGFS